MSSGAIGVLTATKPTKTATFSALRCLKGPCQRSANFSSAVAALRRLAGARRRRAGARLHTARRRTSRPPTDLLEPATRAKTIAQLQHLGVKALQGRAQLGRGGARRPPARRGPSFEATEPGRLRLGRSTTRSSREADAAALEGAADGHLAGAALGDLQRQSALHHAPRRPRLPGIHDRRRRCHYGSEVSLYAIWNEPNHPAFLLPQWNSNGTPASPRIYRGLYQAGYAGLQAAGMAHPQVLFGETAPTGYDTVSVRTRRLKAPAARRRAAAFLREALCLNSHYRMVGSCSELQMTGYAHHAYTLPAGPFYTMAGRGQRHDRVALAALQARSTSRPARTRSPAGVPIYLTEFGVQSVPNKELGVSVATQAEFDAIAERIAWENPRVAAFSQYLLKDDPLGGPRRLERARRHRRLPDRPGVRQRQAQAALLRLAGPADRHQITATATRCGGSCGRPPARPRVTVLRPPEGLPLTSAR